MLKIKVFGNKLERQNRNLLGVLVVDDGQWTSATLQVMAKVFDYVIPISNVAIMAETIAAYLQGDQSKLRWLIDFRIYNNYTI